MSGKEAATGAIGAGIGLAIGYFLPMIIPKPKVAISPNPITPGQTIRFTYTGFPPNASLMSMGGGTGGIGSAPYNIGAVDQNGNMTITGSAPNLPEGSVVLYVVFVATNPKIFATALYYVATS